MFVFLPYKQSVQSCSTCVHITGHVATSAKTLLIICCPGVHMLLDLLDFIGCVIRQPGYEFLSITRLHFHFGLGLLWFEYHSSQFTTPAFRSRIGGWELSVGGTQNVEIKTECVFFFFFNLFCYTQKIWAFQLITWITSLTMPPSK